MNNTKIFKHVSARSFAFSYNNILTADLLELRFDLLENLKKYVVEEHCFSLSQENVLTVYIKTEIKVKFESVHPKLLTLKKFGYPGDLRSILNHKQFVQMLYLNDINTGDFFTIYKYTKRVIGFIEKPKPITFERVTGNDFLVSYKNVSDANLRVIYMILLKRFNDLTFEGAAQNVSGFCCSLDREDTLTIYFRTRQKVDFIEFEPKILVINRLNCRPVDIKLVTYPYGTISTLYQNDVYEGHYFTSSLLIEIAIWREFLPKSKRLADAVLPDVEDYGDYELPSNSEDQMSLTVPLKKEDK